MLAVFFSIVLINYILFLFVAGKRLDEVFAHKGITSLFVLSLFVGTLGLNAAGRIVAPLVSSR